jgi:dihydrofolate reductase
MDLNNGIGYQNKLPWRLPADIQLMKQTTLGHHLIMGRKTYESIGKPLPDRTTIIITRTRGYQADDCLVVHSVPGALSLAKLRGEDEAFIFGGSQIYLESLPYTDRIYLTHIQAELEVDAYFPDFDRSDWVETYTEFYQADQENQFSFDYLIYDRR